MRLLDLLAGLMVLVVLFIVAVVMLGFINAVSGFSVVRFIGWIFNISM